MKQSGSISSSTRGTGRTRVVAAALAAGAVLAFAFSPTPASAATPTTATTISAQKIANVGTILEADIPVYTLKPSKTACDAKCLKIWPAVLLPDGVMAPTAGTGVDASQLGTAPAANGALQITYAGKPLYWFYKDKSATSVHGNLTDKWGKWATVVIAKSGSGGGKSNAGSGGVSF
jgi:predicted lipoprotein with Yx(FWY)xxD motif